MSSIQDRGLRAQGLVKTFDGLDAVDDVSFSIPPGTIYGLLGPNGAGKTTIIRIIMGILGADRGEVIYEDRPVKRSESRRFGYLPEERGLYQKTRLRETLVYFARLKGLTHPDAGRAVDHYIERLELQYYAHKNIQTLSRGNQQKAQFIAAVIHAPDLVILDEPFTGLDPVNQIILKDIIREFQAKGSTVLLSTHQMEQVERLCQEICLINHGKVILAGSLATIKDQYRGQCVEVTFEGGIPADIGHWLQVTETKGSTIVGNPKDKLSSTLKALVDLAPVLEYRVREPTLEEIFIDAVRGVSE